MFKRRSVVAGGLALATLPLAVGAARAEAGRPALVFVGHEL